MGITWWSDPGEIKLSRVPSEGTAAYPEKSSWLHPFSEGEIWQEADFMSLLKKSFHSSFTFTNWLVISHKCSQAMLQQANKRYDFVFHVLLLDVCQPSLDTGLGLLPWKRAYDYSEKHACEQASEPGRERGKEHSTGKSHKDLQGKLIKCDENQKKRLFLLWTSWKEVNTIQRTWCCFHSVSYKVEESIEKIEHGFSSSHVQKYSDWLSQPLLFLCMHIFFFFCFFCAYASFCTQYQDPNLCINHMCLKCKTVFSSHFIIMYESRSGAPRFLFMFLEEAVRLN